MAVSTGRQLAKNSTINLVGQGLPLLVALYCMPKILHNLGEERLGVLALAWMFIGYFTLFDLGLSRAITKELAYWFPKDRLKSIEVFWTGVISTLLLGVVAGLLFYALTPVFVEKVLHIPPSLVEEARGSFLAIAFGLPFVISSVGLRGTLEARSSFLQINLVQTPLGILNYLIPMLISRDTPNLSLIVHFLIGVRVVSWLILAFLVWWNFPGGLEAPKFKISRLKELLSFGGWITVANVVSPLIGYADRFLVGTMISTAAVAYYSTPFEMIMKIWIIPAAISGVIFPTLSSLGEEQKQKMFDLLIGGAKVVFFVMFPIGFCLSTFSNEILSIWLGQNFATESWKILWWFGLAIVANTVGFIPSAFLQSRGRPDIPARLLLIELPFYVTLLLVCLNNLGVEGAAITWMLRAFVDVGFLFYFSFRHLGRSFSFNPRYVFLAVLPIGAFITAISLHTLQMKIGFFVAITTGFILISWKQLLNERERNWLSSLIQIK